MFNTQFLLAVRVTPNKSNHFFWPHLIWALMGPLIWALMGPLIWALMGALIWSLMGSPGLGPYGPPWSGL